MNNPLDSSQIKNWVFDLDNTLYPRSCNLFAQVDKLITQYVMNVTGFEHSEAYKVQKTYYRDSGTTMNGLMQNYGIDPNHYLDFVHDIDYSPVMAHAELVEAISALKGRKFIFTNADIGHSEAVLEKLGASKLFDGMFDIRATGFKPKPEPVAYQKFINEFDIFPSSSIMFDDLEKNLKVPHIMGMKTVQVIADESFNHELVESWELEKCEKNEHVHHITNDLVKFLKVT
ncbi:MAG: pyrimidine 5'-nucleotidase [Rhizobiaceae bacterium]|nr:pyrimidine 5'-nucleotidase [Rhizobiaceae bacterium]